MIGSFMRSTMVSPNKKVLATIIFNGQKIKHVKTQHYHCFISYYMYIYIYVCVCIEIYIYYIYSYTYMYGKIYLYVYSQKHLPHNPIHAVDPNVHLAAAGAARRSQVTRDQTHDLLHQCPLHRFSASPSPTKQ